MRPVKTSSHWFNLDGKQKMRYHYSILYHHATFNIENTNFNQIFHALMYSIDAQAKVSIIQMTHGMDLNTNQKEMGSWSCFLTIKLQWVAYFDQLFLKPERVWSRVLVC